MCIYNSYQNATSCLFFVFVPPLWHIKKSQERPIKP
jgi:hypothetical protein